MKIVLILAFSLIFIAYCILKKIIRKIVYKEPLLSIKPKLLVVPDYPDPFGYKIFWFAIKTLDTQLVVRTLKLASRQQANWQTGMGAVYAHNYVFVSPPMEGWTFVVGYPIGELVNPPHDKGLLKRVRSLAKKFPEFYYFGSYRVVGYCAWMMVKEGSVKRAYGYSDGEVLYDFGEQTIEEKKLGFNFIGAQFPIAEDETNFPDEEDVIKIAEAWSINPQTIRKYEEKGVGISGALYR